MCNKKKECISDAEYRTWGTTSLGAESGSVLGPECLWRVLLFAFRFFVNFGPFWWIIVVLIVSPCKWWNENVLPMANTPLTPVKPAF